MEIKKYNKLTFIILSIDKNKFRFQCVFYKWKKKLLPFQETILPQVEVLAPAVVLLLINMNTWYSSQSTGISCQTDDPRCKNHHTDK